MNMKNRKGAFSIITAVVFFALMSVGAVAVDFSRLWTLKNELQTAADAGALAGAVQLFPARYVNAQGVIDTATTYVTRNPAMSATPGVDSIILGNWDQTARAFTPAGTPQNAVRVVAGYNMSGLVLSAFGVPAPRMRARATAWAEAPVATTGCIKPWAIPYETLMFVINTQRGIANTNANLNRAFDQVADIAALNAMTAAQRTFNLKVGSGGVTQAAAAPGSMPGNFQAVQLGKYWDAATQTYPNPGPQPGGNQYRDNISGETCFGLSVGDSLTTQTGNMVGPTHQGATQVPSTGSPVCTTLINDRSSLTHGDCIQANGSIGNDIKAAFYKCGSGCNGNSTVGVSLLGSFKLMKVFPQGCNNQSPAGLNNCSAGEVVGIFEPLQAQGPVGGGSTTLQKPILTQ